MRIYRPKNVVYYAFFSAVIRGHEQVVCILAEAGVPIDGPPGQTEDTILDAMINGQGDMVKLLLKLGAQPVDPLKSVWAERFLDGTYPLPPLPEPLLKE